MNFHWKEVGAEVFAAIREGRQPYVLQDEIGRIAIGDVLLLWTGPTGEREVILREVTAKTTGAPQVTDGASVLGLRSFVGPTDESIVSALSNGPSDRQKVAARAGVAVDVLAGRLTHLRRLGIVSNIDRGVWALAV